MSDFGVCDALSEKLGTYGAGGGGVALVICRHAFHWVLLSHLQQKKTGEMGGVCCCWNSTTGTNSSFSSSLPADSRACILRTKQIGRIEFCVHRANATQFTALSLVPPPMISSSLPASQCWGLVLRLLSFTHSTNIYEASFFWQGTDPSLKIQP